MSLINLKAQTESEAQLEVQALSEEYPGQYLIVVATFRLQASTCKRLSVHAPSDSCFTWYALNGKLWPFSSKQKIADQNATPTLS